MLTTAQDAVDLVRIQIDDRAEPYLWENAELLHYLDQAQKEFARTTLCFPDYTNFTSAILADEAWIARPERLVELRYGTLSSAGTRVEMRNFNEMRSTTWMTETGTPCYLIADLDASYLRLYPIPVAADTLQLAVYRLPFEDLTTGSEDLEIPEEWREVLLHGVKSRAYLKQDVETYDPEKAAQSQALWQSGVRDARVAMYHIQNRRAGVTRYGGL